jgi:uncharacterized RDD family membrane protein YckC
MTVIAVEHRRAGLCSRLAAFAVDTVLLAAAIGGTAWLLGATARALGRFAPPVDLQALALASGTVMAALYHFVGWTVFGQTVGKWLLGIRVQQLDGARLKPRRALLRLIGYVLSALPLYAGFWWVVGPRRMAWHDWLARSEVVYRERPPAPESPGVRLRRRLAAQIS